MEQPLPPYGACLLGSFNLTKYVTRWEHGSHGYIFDEGQFVDDIIEVVRAMDNVIDTTTFPLPQQEAEAKAKRRMGLGVTGVANAGELMGMHYGSTTFNEWLDDVMSLLANSAYQTSALLAKEKGSFPAFVKEKYLVSRYVQGLDTYTKELIEEHGIRNSHLISVAPTGTISFCADNISSGIEPVFAHLTDRTVITESGPEIFKSVPDWGYANGVQGKTVEECSIDDHLNVLTIASRWSDSAVSKTINIGEGVSWEQFKNVYMRAWKAGCKGCTTFNPKGKRFGILNKAEKGEEAEGQACYIDPKTNQRTCE